MAEGTSARALIDRALTVYDLVPGMAASATASTVTGFDGGLGFLCACTGRAHVRGRGHALGLVKYGLCVVFALAIVVALAGVTAPALPGTVRVPVLALTFVLAFYALESRWVFVFPAAASGEAHPFHASWRLTRDLGGTLAVMRVVLPIAAHMLTGPLVGRGVIRAWATGCLAVMLWYEDLRGVS